jgi:alkanesulfonate monooxygenase SsuD/methylene tetrahydromethanopterin reductase-like flavin-dependent oxidoreductase (luciferase family)
LATLDVLSKGRLIVGVGVGWMREEFEALELPPFEARGAVTDEYIRAFKELWTSDNPSFEGNTAGSRTSRFSPNRCRNRTHPSGWAERAVGLCGAPRNWATAGIPLARTPNSLWQS